MLSLLTRDHIVIGIAVACATAAALKALDLAGRVQWTGLNLQSPTASATRTVLIGGGLWGIDQALVVGFTNLREEAGFLIGPGLLGVLVAILFTGLAFFMVERLRSTPASLIGSGALLGCGLLLIHALGLASRGITVGSGSIWPALGLPITLSVFGATIVLWLGCRQSGIQSKIAAGFLAILTLAGLHYASLTLDLTSIVSAGSAQEIDGLQVALGLTIAALLILFLASLSSMLDRRFAGLAEREARALRVSEERFRNRYQMTPVPLHSVLADGSLDQVSEAWLDLLGYSREEVIGHPLTDFMPNESEARREADWQTLINDGVIIEVEYRLVAKNGDLLDVLLSARAEYDAAGVFVGALAGVVDVTRRKRVEAALRQSQKIEAIGQLTGGVAHDFNNLLAVVLGNLELMRKRLPEDPRLLRMVDSAIQGAQRGAALTQRMLSFARRQDLNPQSVKIDRLIQGIGGLLQNAAGSETAIVVSCPSDLPPARVDANQLELSLLNLAVNARDAMGTGGTLTVSARRILVGAGGFETLSPGEYVCLSVVDTGCGMDEATVMHAREPFFTTKGVGKGTGLGLSMVHGLAEQSGGGLFLSSTVGVGTTAEIWLPVSVEAGPSLPAAIQPIFDTPRALKPLRVLVVDDDALVLMNTVEILEDLGHSVASASSGREGLEIFQRDPQFDIVMTDQAMPHMTGVQFAAQILAIAPGQAIILASGYAEIPEGTALDLPRLRKPYQQATLVRVLAETAPAKAQARRTLAEAHTV